jgi:hypothetical protein
MDTIDTIVRMARRCWLAMLLMTCSLLAGVSLLAETGTPVLSYEVASVTSELLREAPEPVVELGAGERLRAGSILVTGRRSAAEIQCEGYATRFHLGAKTRVKLAEGVPGLLLHLERGRVRGVFDALDTDEPPERIVTTPSALLAVRGTEYALEVGRSGDTTVVVFDGVVEVFDRDRKEAPVRVTQGHTVRVRRGKPPGRPTTHELTREEWDRGLRPAASQTRRDALDTQEGRSTPRTRSEAEPRSRTTSRPRRGG